MNTINLEFMNKSTFEITVIVEPLADEFLLKPKDTIKVVCESLEEITTIYSALMDKETVVICCLEVMLNGDIILMIA
ncbi:hypothetical protein [Acinetobacter bereziniae]|uniref:hypothetical protein n=1 Tax=Acinetobacter bereziniae TaxID=106648 RepID=UPI001116DBD0|nr:hypothetical protein [Acinetobacter bereziniae]TNL47258.1 hypothetical protein EYY58_22525 [Acinetobacter bereziniae]